MNFMEHELRVMFGESELFYTYDGSTYVGHTETKEYESFEDIENALLDMTYETDWIEEAQDKEAEENGWADSEDDAEDSDADYTLLTPAEKEVDNHIFKTVNIEKNSGIFYSVYDEMYGITPVRVTQTTTASSASSSPTPKKQ